MFQADCDGYINRNCYLRGLHKGLLLSQLIEDPRELNQNMYLCINIFIYLFTHTIIITGVNLIQYRNLNTYN